LSLKRVTAPTLELVPLADMKAHLRVTHSAEDALIAQLTAAAVAHLDGPGGLLGWCLGAQTWLLAYDTFPSGPIQLPTGPLIAVTGIEYANAGGAYVTLPATEYTVDDVANPGWIVPVESWPVAEGTNAVRITFTAGHATAGAVNAAALVAIKLLVAHWYRNREAVGDAMSEVPLSAQAIIDAIRWRVV
jgi:uncharacterized phiE125 gp8 family phage protein